MMTVEPAKRVRRSDSASTYSGVGFAYQTGPMSLRYWRRTIAKVVNGVDPNSPVPYSMTLLGAVQNLMWKLELETDPELWVIIKPKIHHVVELHFGKLVADAVLD